MRCFHASLLAALVVAALASSTSLCAQVVFRAVTRSGLFASGGAPQSVPANTDITAGRFLQSTGSWPTGSATATVSFSVSRSNRALDIVLDESGTATFNPQGAFIFPRAQVGDTSVLPPTHSIDVQLSSPTPMRVRLALTTCSDWGGFYDGTLAIPGFGVVSNTSWQGVSCAAPTPLTVDLTLGPTPTVLVFTTQGWCQSSRISTYVQFKGRWALSITNVSPCDGLAYETPCGATLKSYGTLNEPGTWLELVDSAPPSAAILLVGTQRLRLALGTCFVYTDFPVILTFVLTSAQGAVVYLPPPPFPAMINAQALTVGPAGFHATNGLEVRCK